MIAFLSGRSRAHQARSLAVSVAAALAASLGWGAACAAGEPPEIRLSKTNVVPQCATPERLMAFLKRRNATLSPRFRDIAVHYKTHGERWRVRWDYAFFQMAIETNFLTYRRPNGTMGDVDPKQNNFAGIGTTGGGVPGDSFPDVSTGVLGQIQHLVAYSGEAVPNPVAQRTLLKQEHILAKSRELARPVRFSDLSKRWAVDPKYGNSIEWVAQRFRNEFCPQGAGRQDAEVLPWQRQSEASPGPAQESSSAVRTVWSRDQAARAAATGGGTGKGAAKAATSDTSAKPGTQAQAQAQALPSPVTAETQAASEPEAHFALFTPPAALADAHVPSEAAPTAQSVSTTAAAEEKAAEVTVRAPRGETFGPPPPEPAMGPPPPPELPIAASPPQAMATESRSANFLPPSGLGVKPGRCLIETATFAGETTVLVKAPVGTDVHYVALSVLDGFEESMTKSFLDARPQGGEALGVFRTKDAALAEARKLCAE